MCQTPRLSMNVATSTTTPPATWDNICVQEVVQVPARAMGSTGIVSRPPMSPQHVISHSHWFKMFGVHTISNTTQMVNSQSFGDGANEKLVGKAVGKYMYSVNTEHPVAFACCTNPQPACLGFDNLSPKTLYCRSLVPRRRLGFASVVNPCRHNKTPWHQLEAHSVSREPPSDTRGHWIHYIRRQAAAAIPAENVELPNNGILGEKA